MYIHVLWPSAIVPLPAPPGDQEENQHGDVERQQRGVETTAEEDAFRDETPVDRPLVEELAADVEGAGQVGGWTDEQEWPGDQQLDNRGDRSLSSGILRGVRTRWPAAGQQGWPLA